MRKFALPLAFLGLTLGAAEHTAVVSADLDWNGIEWNPQTEGFTSEDSAYLTIENGALVKLPAEFPELGYFSVKSTGETRGTLVVESVCPKSDVLLAALQRSDWNGNLRLSAIEGTVYNIDFGLYGNSNSVVTVNGISGLLAKNGKCDAKVVLEDGAERSALTLTNGYGKAAYEFAELSGSGTISDVNNNAKQIIRILSADDFTGSISVQNKRIVFGTDDVDRNMCHSITVSTNSSVTLASGATWTGTDGMLVAGKLVSEGGSAPDDVTFAKGATLDLAAGEPLEIRGTLVLEDEFNVEGEGIGRGSPIFAVDAEPESLPRVTVGDKTRWIKWTNGHIVICSFGIMVIVR